MLCEIALKISERTERYNSLVEFKIRAPAESSGAHLWRKCKLCFKRVRLNNSATTARVIRLFRIGEFRSGLNLDAINRRAARLTVS